MKKMKGLFNRQFFKFTFGFISLVLIGLLGLLVTDFRDVDNEESSATVFYSAE
ncbi:MAG: hypothetical protein NUV49_00775 [Patescibacteria group bacterium]|nr:hypothetical protein [Patescibacteria group bacterium]